MGVTSLAITWDTRKYRKQVNYEHGLHSVIGLWFSTSRRICEWRISTLTTTGSDDGLSPARRQAIIWTDAWILLILPLGTNFSDILIEIHTFSFKKMHLKMSSGKRRSIIKPHNEHGQFGKQFSVIRTARLLSSVNYIRVLPCSFQSRGFSDMINMFSKGIYFNWHRWLL